MMQSESLRGKKVACVGNTNQIFFALARYLRDKGLLVDLFVPQGLHGYFAPENDSYASLPSWVHTVPWGIEGRSVFLHYFQYRKVLSRYDLVLGCTLAPAICWLANHPLDIFIPHGADLYAFPFPPEGPLWHKSNIINASIAKMQSNGIQASRLVLINDRVPVYKRALQKLGVTALQLGTPTLYTGEYSEENIKKHVKQLKFYDQFVQLREQNDIIIFSHSRQLWEKKLDGLDIGKGNHILIEGFAKFCAKSRARAILELFELGPDVEKSKRLIANLGIEDKVKWMPLMPRKEIMAGLSLADIGADQFVSASFGGTGQEILAAGKPLLVYLDTHQGNDDNINIPPCVNVKSADEICNALLRYEYDKKQYVTLGHLAKQWFVRYRGAGLANAIILLMSGLLYRKSRDELEEIIYNSMRGGFSNIRDNNLGQIE
jgi:hypothetical protein